MRHLLALILLVLLSGSCDGPKEELPPMQATFPPASTSKAESAEQVQRCANEACEAACANMTADIKDDCPMAYAAGCFDGSAPADYPCESFIQAKKATVPPAAVVPDDSVAPVPKSKARPAAVKGDREDGVKTTPIGD